MKATLLPRQSVRLAWFKAENIPAHVERKVEISYSEISLSNDIPRTGTSQFVLSGLEKQVPSSQIIIFDKTLGLPQSYGKTSGSVGNRLSTDWQNDLEVEIVDRLVMYNQGKETVKIEPPPSHLRARLKEIEIRERDDVITRKIVVKNLTARRIESLRILLSESKNVKYDGAKIEPTKKDPPEYTWSVDVPPDGTTVIEFTLKLHVVKVFEIEKEIIRAVANAPSMQQHD